MQDKVEIPASARGWLGNIMDESPSGPPTSQWKEITWKCWLQRRDMWRKWSPKKNYVLHWRTEVAAIWVSTEWRKWPHSQCLKWMTIKWRKLSHFKKVFSNRNSSKLTLPFFHFFYRYNTNVFSSKRVRTYEMLLDDMLLEYSRNAGAAEGSSDHQAIETFPHKKSSFCRIGIQMFSERRGKCLFLCRLAVPQLPEEEGGGGGLKKSKHTQTKLYNYRFFCRRSRNESLQLWSFGRETWVAENITHGSITCWAFFFALKKQQPQKWGGRVRKEEGKTNIGKKEMLGEKRRPIKKSGKQKRNGIINLLPTAAEGAFMKTRILRSKNSFQNGTVLH